jgi:S-adenosylmethionine:tRNA ribosyltransferase-isomerase
MVGGGCTLTVLEKTTKGYLLKPNFPITQIYDILEKHGTTPIPPYIKNPNLEEQKLREDYQTIFAKHQGSVAAPTASLHFSEKLIEKIKSAGIQIEYVTLHVGLGTFAPLTEDHIKSGNLHEEWYEVSTDTAERLNQAKEQGKIIIPVGTTSTRTLESASDENHKLKKLTGTTTLFIQENYQFKFADSIITNFHVPKSSLLMLVSAFATRKKLLEIYKTAITKNYKLFSFGDGMLIL